MVIQPSFESGRTGSQCRERWRNYVRPDIRKRNWDPFKTRLFCMRRPLHFECKVLRQMAQSFWGHTHTDRQPPPLVSWKRKGTRHMCMIQSYDNFKESKIRHTTCR